MNGQATRKAGWRGNAKRLTVAALALALPLIGVAAPPAGAATLSAGPVDSSTRFPLWVAAGSDRLDLCLDDPSCLGTSAGLVPPGGEAFWFNATATLGGNTPGLVEMATEAAFAADGPGQEIAFNRIRIRLDVPSAGTYRVDYPYGSKTFTVAAVSDAGKEINFTQDIGCLTVPCGAFSGLADSGDGGVGDAFLTWDPSVAPAAPQGFIGDGLSEHKVVGSPIGRNFVDVVRTDLATPQTITHAETFAVQGKIARPRVLATPAPGSYKTAQSVVLQASEPGATIRYTTDGSSPTDASGNVVGSASAYSAPIAVTADTTIKAVNAVGGVAVTDPVTGQPSAPSAFTYVIDNVAPSVTVDPASGTYASAQLATMAATDAKDAAAKIHYTIGTGAAPGDPTPSSTLYTGPVPVNGNADGAHTFVKAIAVDAAGNVSPVVSRDYVISAPDVSASPAGGSYTTAVDVRLSATDPEAQIFYNTAGLDPLVRRSSTGAVTGADNGTLYTNDPIHLTGDTTLKFVVAGAAGQSTVKTESYLIDVPANRPPGALGSVGPVDAATGYPFWYGDKGGTSSSLAPNRLELCLDDPLCPVVGDLPDPSKPLSYPDNFPDESFWWSGEAAIAVPGGPSSLLVLAQEAAFGGAGTVVPGEQISFARLRIRLDDVVPGAKYTVTSPYGVDVVTADDRGRARSTEDVGCLAAPCTWKESLDGRIGPFLRWDPSIAPAAPVGYVGNPLVEHQVVGSPHGTNFFRVEGPNIGGPGIDRVETDLFTVQGRLAQLRATASPGGALYSKPQDVAIQASFPAEAKIVWTTDGSNPAVDPATGVVTNGQEFVPATGDVNAKALVHVAEGRTTLKFMAVDLTSHSTSQIYTEEYAVSGTLPTVSASPDPANGPFQGLQAVTLTSSTGSAVWYTTDGTTPKLDASGNPLGTTTNFGAAVQVGRPTTVKTAAVDALGALGPVATFVYDIHNLKAVGPVSPTNGYPAWFEDYGSSTLPPVKLQLCLDDPLCPVVGDLPDPTAPLSFPDNFPDESFWWSGGADFAVGAGRARLTLATEAAFATLDVQPNQQIAFSRIRVRADNLVPGATYKVLHPYGELELTADAAGVISSTDDSGCLAAPCDFSQVLRAPVGPFLRWTGTDAPAGYVGDGATPHTVTGSPYGRNTFRIEQVTDASGAALTTPTVVGQTDQFVVQGKIAALQATASPVGGTYTTAQQVTLSSTDAAAPIFYTTDGSTPTAASTQYAGPITIANEGTTVLKFVAIANGISSPVVTETYLIDTIAPTVTMNPNGGTFAAAQSVTITSNDANASIYYTTDGSTPTAAGTKYTGPVSVPRTLTLKARAIDTAGNIGDVVSANFTIGLPTTGLTLGTPSPAIVTFGPTGTTTLSGVLTSAGGPISGRTVAVQSRALGSSTWVGVTGKSAVTGLDGRYSVTGVSPTATVDYRAVFPGDASFQASSSAAQRVQVRAVLSLNAPNPSTVSRGRNVTYSGTLAPTHSGARITITVSATGQRALTASATVAANGTWTVTTKAPGKEGSWRVTATWGGDADHLAPTPAVTNLTVVK